MFEIIFNNKGSFSDFGTLLDGFKPQPPTPKIITDDVPGMNGTYNFSTVLSNGEPVYNTREITCTLDFFASSKEELMTKYSEVLEWLLSGQHELIYTGESDKYYIAQVEKEPKFDLIDANNGTLDITFTAQPFKYSIDEFGDDIWDNFNFLTDYTQYTNTFTISSTTTVKAYNNGRNITPTINCSSAMTLSFNNVTYNLIAGDNTPWGLKLVNGENDLTFTGNGTVKIIFKAEVL